MNITKVILILLAIIGLLIIFLGLFQLQIYFPFNITDAEPIPYHRWQGVRFATIATIIYFIVQYLVGSRPSSALSFLNVYFKFFIFFLTILMWQANVEIGEWSVLGFFVFVTILLHIERKSNARERHW